MVFESTGTAVRDGHTMHCQLLNSDIQTGWNRRL